MKLDQRWRVVAKFPLSATFNLRLGEVTAPVLDRLQLLKGRTYCMAVDEKTGELWMKLKPQSRLKKDRNAVGKTGA